MKFRRAKREGRVVWLLGLCCIDHGMMVNTVINIRLPIESEGDDTPCPRGRESAGFRYSSRWGRCACYSSKSGLAVYCLVELGPDL